VNGSGLIRPVAGSDGPREMQIELLAGRYSGFALTHFPGDWRGYTILVITLASDDTPPLPLTCRIHDRAHDTNNRFDDRYNGRFPLVAGVQEIRIDLAEVEHAPATRSLDLSTVAGLGCFFVALDTPRKLSIQQVELQREPQQ
jgi:hypothetical protein